jgi:hypothetical protein
MPRDKRKVESDAIEASLRRVASIPYLKKQIPHCSQYMEDEYLEDYIHEHMRKEWETYTARNILIKIEDLAYDIKEELEGTVLKYYITE